MRLLVVGCGLAGAALAWAAHRRGWALSIVDRVDLQSSSHVAAGLVTPITGSRSAATWRWESFFESATKHYTDIETRTNSTFWHLQPAIRLFGSPQERERAIERWSFSPTELESSFRPRISLCSPEELSGFHAPFGGCRMEPAARLDTTTYLLATRTFFQGRGEFIASELDVDGQLPLIQQAGNYSVEVDVDNQTIRADAIAFCQGFEARSNEWFTSLPLHPARGDILTLSLDSDSREEGEWTKPGECSVAIENDVKLPGLAASHVVHSDAWLVPTGDRYLVGATYDRHHLNGLVNGEEFAMENRQILLERLNNMFPEINKGRWSVEQHRAAVRPASYDRHPLIGRHRAISNAYTLNGLGSKGSLMAPLLAEELCDCIETGKSVDPLLDWRRRDPPMSQR